MIGSEGGPFAFCLSLKTLPMQYREVDFSDSGQGRYMGSSFQEFLVAFRDELKLKAPKTTEKPKPLPPPAKDKPLRELKGFPHEVTSIAVSPCESQLLASGVGSVVLRFDLQTGKPLHMAPRGEEEYVRPVAGWLCDRPIIIQDKNLTDYSKEPPYESCYSFHLMDAVANTEVCLLEGLKEPGGNRSEYAEFSSDGTRFAYSNGRGQFFGDPHTGKRLNSLPSAAGEALALAWNPESTLLAVGRQTYIFAFEGNQLLEPDWIVLILDRDGKEQSRIESDPPARPKGNDSEKSHPGVSRVEFSPSGKRLLLVKRSVVRIHAMDGAIPSPRPLQEIKVPMRNVHSACFVGDDRLALTTLEGEIMIYSLETGKPLRKWQSTKLQGGVIRATPDGKFLLTANGRSDSSSVSKSVRVWKVDV